MKSHISALSALLALSLPAAAQKAGDAVTTEVFTKIDWVQGEAPKAWEPGKPYIIECWATWCGPCLAAIPHVDALFDKYQSKGLHVIGMNVWEDGKEKVEEFVKKKGDGMSYPVAYTGKGGAFETEWLKPAGVRGIPHAFVVMDGKVLFTTHPAKLSEEIIEQLLTGPEGAAKVAETMASAAKNEGVMQEKMKAFGQAADKGDLDAMKSAAAELKKIPDAARVIPQIDLTISMKSEDWAAAKTQLEAMKSESAYAMILSSVIPPLVTPDSKAPEDFRKYVATALKEILAGPDAKPLQFISLARLQWVNGEKDAAIESCSQQLESLKKPENKKYAPLVGANEKFVAALKAGTLPTDKEYYDWIREAQAVKAPATPEQ